MSVVNPLTQKLQKLIISAVDDTPYSEMELEELTENGAEAQNKKISVIKLQISLNEKMSGSPFICYFAARLNEQNEYFTRLIKMETTIFGELGTLVYTLKSVDYNL